MVNEYRATVTGPGHVPVIQAPNGTMWGQGQFDMNRIAAELNRLFSICEKAKRELAAGQHLAARQTLEEARAFPHSPVPLPPAGPEQ